MLDVDDTKRAPARGRYDRGRTVSERINTQRTLILEGLRDALVHSMPSSITVKELAKKTGLGRNTLYGHFPSVEAGCRVVIEQCWDDLRTQLEERPLGSATPLALCAELSERWLEAVTLEPKSVDILINCDAQRLAGVLVTELADLWRLGARAGAFAAESDPIRLQALAAALLQLVRLVVRDQADPAHCSGVMTDLLSRGLR